MIEWWTAELLDRNNNKLGTLPGIKGGGLKWSTFRSVEGDGTLDLVENVSADINWLSDRIRIVHHRKQNELAEEEIRYQGVYLISIPSWQQTRSIRSTSITLTDTTEILNTPIGKWLTYGVGSVPTTLIASILAERGIEHVKLTASASTLNKVATWKPQDTWLKVTNDLANRINYNNLSADLLGYIRVDPYKIPSKRPVVAVYGGEALDLRMKYEWTDESNLYEVPTGFVIYVDGDEETPGLIGRADLPDSHPMSAVSRGYEKLESDSGDAETQALANELAARRLDDAMQVTRRISIKHAINDTKLNEVVKHAPLNLTGPIVERDITFGLGACVTDVIRRIYVEGDDLPWI